MSIVTLPGMVCSSFDIDASSELNVAVAEAAGVGPSEVKPLIASTAFITGT